MMKKGTRRKELCLRGHKRPDDAIGKNCPQCDDDRHATYYSKHRERLLKYYRESAIHRERAWRLAGIINQDGSTFTIKDYNSAFQIQGGACKGCGQHQSNFKQALCADHNHSSGCFRGLLCRLCNALIGLCKDDRKILIDMIAYLDENKEKLN